MEKVKVQRYFSGKRPHYAIANSNEESEEEDFTEKLMRKSYDDGSFTNVDSCTKTKDDKTKDDKTKEDNPHLLEQHRHIHQIKLIKRSTPIKVVSSDSEELSESEITKRRRVLKKHILSKEKTTKLIEDEKEDESSEESFYSEEDTVIKPLFIHKEDRITIMEKEKEMIQQLQAEIEAEKWTEDRRRDSIKMVEESVRKEIQINNRYDTKEESRLSDVCSDDENDEAANKSWKLRELKRIKRNRKERKRRQRERLEIERIRNMTKNERRHEARLNPKIITNKADKGKFKFLQKYYHRGAFYLDKDDAILKRDTSDATLEDHFDKTIMPKIKQVKNFGHIGRTKYTHLVDQDTTQFDSPWISAKNLEFHKNHAAGMKQIFERPSYRRKFDNGLLQT